MWLMATVLNSIAVVGICYTSKIICWLFTTTEIGDLLKPR